MAAGIEESTGAGGFGGITNGAINSFEDTANSVTSQSLAYSIFNSCKDNYPKKKTGTFDDLADLCRKPSVRVDKDGRAFCPSIFEGHRAVKNAQFCGFLALDLDGLPEHVSAENVLDCMPGLTAFVYSSHSHLLPGKGARFRVVVLLDSPIPADRYKTLCVAFAGRFDCWPDAVDTKCFEPARIFYFPSCTADRLEHFEYMQQEASPLNWKALVGTNTPPPTSKTLVAPPRALSDAFAGLPPNIVENVDRGKLSAALEFISPDGYDEWLKVGMALRDLHEEGFLIWDKWSSQSAKYPGAAELLKKWSGFQYGGGVGFGTVFHLAKMAGFVMNPPIEAPGNVVREVAISEASQVTELAMAKAIAQAYGGRFCHVAEPGRLLVLEQDTGLWTEDYSGLVDRWFFDLLRDGKEMAFSLIRDRNDSGAKLLSAILKAERNNFVMGSKAMVKALKGVTVKQNLFDANPYLVAFLGGKCANLKTGEIRDICPADYFTKTLGTEYQSGVDCPLWKKSLVEWCRGDAELAKFLQVWIGYCLSGLVEFQGLLFLFGFGANGKSVFINIVSHLLGEYARALPAESLMMRGNDSGATNDIARLAGARLVTSSELPEGRIFNENLIKSLTGGDVVSARFLYGEFFEFKPCLKLAISGNHKPIIRGTDHGIWRRVHLVPFLATVESPDADLTNKLRGELPGILNWALE